MYASCTMSVPAAVVVETFPRRDKRMQRHPPISQGNRMSLKRCLMECPSDRIEPMSGEEDPGNENMHISSDADL